MKYHVNANCIGCGLCAATCPEVFSMTDGGVSRAADAPVPEKAAAAAKKCMIRCPVNAIEAK